MLPFFPQKLNFHSYMSNLKPILYVKQGCPWCVQAEEYFSQKSIEYQRINVLESVDGLKALEDSSGQLSTPTWVFGKEVIPDFSVDEFQEALKKNPSTKSLFN